MSVASATLAGRRAAEARMLDTFEVRVPTGTGYTYDPVTQSDVPAYTVSFITVGRVKVGGGLAARDTEVGGRTAVEVSREWHIPVDSPVVPTDAYAVCTAVHPTSDPTLLGASLTLAGPAPGSQTTARRLQVTEVIS